MSAILKKNEPGVGQLVRPISFLREPHRNSGGQESDSKRNAGADLESLSKDTSASFSQTKVLEALERENERLLDSIAALKKEAEENTESAFLAGKKEGLAAAVADERERVSTLSEAAQEALGGLGDQMKSLEGLAILLAQTALNKMFGPDEQMSSFVSRSISHHLQKIEDLSELRISVSQEDFGEKESLDALDNAIGHPGVKITIDQNLKRGDCLMGMRLGTADIGITGQLSKLNELFTEMSSGEQM